MAARQRALISVSDKTGLEEFARGLVELGYEILSTGGTSKALQAAGLPVTDVSEYTGFPEMMDGRLKTLHPRVHGGLLGRPDLPEHVAAMAEHRIVPFAMVVVNLYPFVKTVQRPGVTLPEAIEQIDIGGPSMLRSAAKNHQFVLPVCSPEQYSIVLAALRSGSVSSSLRHELAAHAFATTAAYDAAISTYLQQSSHQISGAVADETAQQPASSTVGSSATGPGDFPDRLTLSFSRRSKLRYGENPHQNAAFYVEDQFSGSSLAAADVLHGKELSYNNLLDLDAALNIVREIAGPAACVIKHNNPCGAGVGQTLAEAFRRAYEGDPVSAFGGIVGLNRPVDEATAEELVRENQFLEAIIAPDFSPIALEMIQTRPKWKSSVRLLRCPGMLNERPVATDLRRVTGGLLIQDFDDQQQSEDQWRVVTTTHPTPKQLVDLRLAWQIVRYVKSNAIVLAANSSIIGVGAGQMSRVDSVVISTQKAGSKAIGSSLASDAFFPFADGVEHAAKCGVKAIIQPGGSRNDASVIECCNAHGVAMLFTGRRHFRH